ncbi:ABC transporter substrate-binding protein [Sphingomonas profundi]|uniref:ABC transporter substrate-binding protein n=1 Tax=Alterirhizorhabdus profundi TaxID=2681549 RepID=UPI0012E7EC8A|nr:ABC transporter substrate-binding protein [Sphingomonas profundi]
MRASVLLAGLIATALPIPIGGAARAAATARPMRVMSMNQCTDQIVLALLPPARIASVTWLARDAGGSLMYRQALRVGINHGLAEEVVRQEPDLVITGSFTTPATRGLLRRLRYPMIEVDHTGSFAAIRTATRQIAAAVGEERRGEALIAGMDRDLAELARNPGPPLRVAAWDGAGFSATKGSLFDAVLGAAGAVNVANQPPASGYGKPDTEVLLLSAPALLVKGAGVGRAPGMHDNLDRHPVVRRYWDGARTLTIRQAYYVCGTPMIGKAIARLRQELRDAARQIHAPLPFAPAGRR